MRYSKTITLKDGRECLIRNCEGDDAPTMCELFALCHAETDYLLSYPDENSFTSEEEREHLAKKAESDRETELAAFVGGAMVGTAGIEAVGEKDKVRRRADFGISVEKAYWGLGIGRALAESCIECARSAGYVQLELNVVADNARAIALYRSLGFKEYGRNPKGFHSRISGWQELVYMRLELV